MANDNLYLGKQDLDGNFQAKRGMPQIEVSFYFDENDLLNMSAFD